METSRPSPRTNRTRRVPHPVLIGQGWREPKCPCCTRYAEHAAGRCSADTHPRSSRSKHAVRRKVLCWCVRAPAEAVTRASVGRRCWQRSGARLHSASGRSRARPTSWPRYREHPAAFRPRGEQCLYRRRADSDPPPRRTKWTRRVPPPVLIGHAASLNPYPQDMKRQNGALFRSGGRLARWRTRVHRGMTSRQKKRGKSGASPGPEPMYGLQRGASGADLNCRATVLRNALPRGRLLAGIVVLLEFRAELCSILQAKLLCADTWGSQTM